MSSSSNIKPTLIYNCVRSYFRFVHNKMYYRSFSVLGKENIPQDGTPTLIVSNHQNCLNDPLAVQFTFYDRKINVFARADVFNNPIAAKFLNFLGLIPAYRMSHEGIDSVSNNKKTFDIASDELVKGRTVLMYPEAGHQDKRWLGNFSMAYIILAFEAAEKCNFEKEIYILPSANHYSNYFHIQSDLLVKYGKPIPLSPYYEKFKQKPRTVQRELNAIVRERIKELMLNIEDLDNYQALDYIRNSYGIEYAQSKDYNPNVLSDKLLSDKDLIFKLEDYKDYDPIDAKNIFKQALEVEKIEKELDFRQWNYTKKFSATSVFFKLILGIILFPLFLFSLVPNIFIFLAPKIITKKIEDHMFDGSIYYGLSALVTIPIFYILTFIIVLNVTGILWISLIHLCLLPFLGLFAWKYRIGFIKLKSEIRFNNLKKKGGLLRLLASRENLITKMKNVVSLVKDEAMRI